MDSSPQVINNHKFRGVNKEYAFVSSSWGRRHHVVCADGSFLSSVVSLGLGIQAVCVFASDVLTEMALKEGAVWDKRSLL